MAKRKQTPPETAAILANLVERTISAAETPETFASFMERLTLAELGTLVLVLRYNVPVHRVHARWLLKKMLECPRSYLLRQLLESNDSRAFASELRTRYAVARTAGRDGVMAEAMVAADAKAAAKAAHTRIEPPPLPPAA